jgi:hypothetical protein
MVPLTPSSPWRQERGLGERLQASASGFGNEIATSVRARWGLLRMKPFTCFASQNGGSEMRVRGFTWQILSIAVVALLLAVPGISQADVAARYSFSKDVSDSIGGRDGDLQGNAVVSGGQLVLDGNGSYADLPIGDLIAGLTDSTFETWVTLNVYLGQAWARIFDFGNDTGTNMFLVPRNGSNNVPRFALTTALDPTGGGAGNEQQVQAALHFPIGVETHVAVTIDSVNQIATLYVNGLPAATIYNYTYTPSSMGFTLANYLGKSQYADPYLNGSINEFRIYDFALSASQIAASFAAGPDGTPP